MTTKEQLDQVTILLAGDSGDGIQLTGSQFTQTTALFGNDLSTFPDFPAEIRAPMGTLAGVSGFQIHFGSSEIYTPGDLCDVLVAFNAAALKKNLDRLKDRGIIICNTSGFDKRNLRLAQYEENPLLEETLRENYQLIEIDVTKMTRDALSESGLSPKDRDRSKNMFVLGFIYWLFGRPMKGTIDFLDSKFKKNPAVAQANIKVLKAGYYYGDTVEAIPSTFEISPAKMPKGTYRNIMGNQAAAIGLVAACKKAGLPLFFGGYPITPATDILQELAKHKNFNVKTFQAEDEIAGICTAIGASFGGSLGVTASSGPGIALKGEAMGLAIMLELPLVIINVQRGGPSTGLPTKTEQSDLFQAMYGRNGEAPMPILAAGSPKDCFETVYEACKLAIEHMTPVMVLSDGYIANGAEPWRFPNATSLAEIDTKFVDVEKADSFKPYGRDENLVREWAIPGMKGFEHRIGGLEKELETGNVSYDAKNHQTMVNIRAEKVDKIASIIPKITPDSGELNGKLAVLGWGSTYGAIKTAVRALILEGLDVAHIHLRHIHPMPENLEEVLKSYDHILIPELNNGQLIKMIREKFLIDAKGLSKVEGNPFASGEIKEAIKAYYL
mgnify:FL=1